MSKVIKATRVSLGKEIELDTPIIKKDIYNFNEIKERDQKKVENKEVIQNSESDENVAEEKEEPKSKEEIEMMYIEEARKKSELFFEEEMKKAYSEGIQKAEAEANEVIVNAKAEAEEMLGNAQIEAEKIIDEAIQMKNKITEEYKNVMGTVERDVVDLVIEMVQRVVAKEIKSDDYIIGIVSEALEKTASKKDTILKVSDEDYYFIIENKDKILLNVEGFGDVEIIKESSLERGSCIVESGFGIVDGGVKTRMMQIEKEIQKILNR